MEWYIILSLILTVITTLAALFITYKVRIITNFKTLFDGVRNEDDLAAAADLLGITVDVIKSVFKIFNINLDIGDE